LFVWNCPRKCHASLPYTALCSGIESCAVIAPLIPSHWPEKSRTSPTRNGAGTGFGAAEVAAALFAAGFFAGVRFCGALSRRFTGENAIAAHSATRAAAKAPLRFRTSAAFALFGDFIFFTL